MQLAPYSMKTNTLYEMKLTVTIVSTSKSSTTSVLVFVNPSPVVAKIDGGLGRAIPVGGDLTLDGSSSYDMDIYGLTGLRSGLTFLWSCRQVGLGLSLRRFCSLRFKGLFIFTRGILCNMEWCIRQL